jgi:hypothetical protein
MEEQNKQALIEMMKGDEELGLYEPNHSTAELERLREVNEGLVDALEAYKSVCDLIRMPYEQELNDCNELAKQALANAKTKEG